MLLSNIVITSRKVAETQSRTEKIGYLGASLRRLAPDEIELGACYLSGRLRQGNIGIGPALLHSVKSASVGGPEEASLSLAEVDAVFDRIARSTGAGSTGERRRLLGALLSKATGEEQDFLVRLALGELRQGALEGLMTDAIAQAAEVPLSVVRRAVMLAGDLGPVAKAALTAGTAGLTAFSLRVLHPLQPMLAQTADDVTEPLSRWGQAAFEYKMDGARVQVHRVGQDVRVFTRTLNDVTDAVPELVEAARQMPAEAFVLDGEVLAFKPDGLPYPFQVTMRRFGRKLDVAQARADLPLTTYFFDCLHADGQDLVDRSAQDRVAALRAIVPAALVTPRLETAEAAAAEAFLQHALRHGHEGVMAKSLQGPYEAGRRGAGWMKIKRAHTLDLVVLAAEWGNGRRQGWLSNLHLGARDPSTGTYVMLGKTFKGMTDAMLEWQTQTFKALEVASDGYTVYLRPEIVVEIAFNDIQASPHYPGGMALRFARVKRYRPDKRAEDADTIETVRALYAGQSGVGAAAS